MPFLWNSFWAKVVWYSARVGRDLEQPEHVRQMSAEAIQDFNLVAHGVSKRQTNGTEQKYSRLHLK